MCRVQRCRSRQRRNRQCDRTLGKRVAENRLAARALIARGALVGRCESARQGERCRARERLRDGEWRVLSQLIRSRERIREVGDTEAGTNHGRSFAIEIVSQADARPNIAVTGLNARGPAHAVLACKIEDQRIFVEVRQLVVLLHIRSKHVVTHAKVERQAGRNLPIVLNKTGVLLIGDVVRQ